MMSRPPASKRDSPRCLASIHLISARAARAPAAAQPTTDRPTDRPPELPTAERRSARGFAGAAFIYSDADAGAADRASVGGGRLMANKILAAARLRAALERALQRVVFIRRRH